MVLHLHIAGKVQGVFYRASAKEIADQLGIRGWVRNTQNGEVEIMALGDKQALERFVSWCREGPPKARVTEVRVTEKEEMEFGQFSIVKTSY
ncbi:MAG TPA: acylphosphatase [Puia sp.]|nr:acylphosphatase [Puia sp.]